ncbi:hypothetical protein [Lentilactobacillus laojiaonis]|uniref:hypothetical protein n=1 Tax=Lentilactobacillus laojiaonis TaxID=2883998 RepID=UPI001D09EDC8|nr:hypothetical protein [Lentilactobacillus laojiaonis]UDM32023.1 hypothetical protein LHL71_05715 [Lentilactobacillus laojiaonis]
MKKIIWGLVTIIIISIIGSFAYTVHANNKRGYYGEMNQSKILINDKKYSAAQTSTMNALEYKPHDQPASNLLYQIQTFIEANDLAENNEVSHAIDEYYKVTKVKDGNSQLIKRAKVQIKDLTLVKNRLAAYQDTYNEAWADNKAGEYADSNVTLNIILDSSQNKLPYYTEIVDKAKKLQQQNNQAIKNKKHHQTSKSQVNDFETSSKQAKDNPNLDFKKPLTKKQKVQQAMQAAQQAQANSQNKNSGNDLINQHQSLDGILNSVK